MANWSDRPRCPRCGGAMDLGNGRLVAVCPSFACALQECGGDRAAAAKLFYERQQLPPDIRVGSEEKVRSRSGSRNRKLSQRGGGLID